jgi:hypothetical protein
MTLSKHKQLYRRKSVIVWLASRSIVGPGQVEWKRVYRITHGTFIGVENGSSALKPYPWNTGVHWYIRQVILLHDVST